MADLVKGLLLSLLSEKCYEEYFDNHNFFDGKLVILIIPYF